MSKQILERPEENQAIVHVEPISHVKELLTKLKETTAEREALKEQLDRTILDDIDSCDVVIEAITAEIKDLVSFEIQDSIKTEDGEATYRKGKTRISYDRKVLDAIMDKKIREAIEPARKETQVKGSVSIEVY